MSVLDTNNMLPTDAAAQTAEQLKENARRTFKMLVASFTSNAKLFWRNPNASPAQIAAALGTDGAELFQLHAKIGALLAEVKPESVQLGAEMVGQFTINEDGTIAVP